jgi:hypothetical protein
LELGVTPLCTFFYYFTQGGAAALSFAGAIMVAVSLYRLIEASQRSGTGNIVGVPKKER